MKKFFVEIVMSLRELFSGLFSEIGLWLRNYKNL